MLTDKIKLEDDEEVLVLVRKHWFILFVQLFNLAILAILPIAAYFLFLKFAGNFDLTIDTGAYQTALYYGYAAWLLVMWMMGFNIWTHYYLDVWTVTSRRLIAVDQRGLFYRTTGSFRLERLQDMNVEIQGIIATFLDYGMLQAQTAAGSEEEFQAHGLPHPRELKSTILEAADRLIVHSDRESSDLSGV